MMRTVILTTILVLVCVAWVRSAPVPDMWADPPSLAPQDWLVIGPFPADRAAEGKLRPGLERDYLTAAGGEAQAKIAADTTIAVDQAQFAVKAIALNEWGAIDFVKVYDADTNATTDTDLKVAYAYAEWSVPAAATLRALFGSDDGAAIWLNGKEIHRIATPGRGVEIGQDRFDLPLVAGSNRMLVKVENGTGGWGMGLRVYNDQGLKRLREIEVRRDLESLDPGPQNGGFSIESSFPTLVWRNGTAAALVLAEGAPLAVRWFDPELNEVKSPEKFGRYTALIETTTRDGWLHRRMLTFVKVSPEVGARFRMYVSPPPLGEPPPMSIPWEQVGIRSLSAMDQAELSRHTWRALGEYMMRSEGGAIAMASLIDHQAADPAAQPTWLDSGFIANAEHQLKLRMKLEGRTPRTLAPPEKLATPAPVLRDGSEAEAGLKAGTVQKLRDVCGEWVKDDTNGFVVLVARRGVVAMHEGFGGADKNTPFVPASIGKPIAGLTFARAVDQGLLKFDQPVGDVLPAWKVPPTDAVTFRYCFTHLSGLGGHASHGGLFNPYVDEALWGQDAIFATPGVARRYSGDGNNLAGTALELTTGQSMWRLLHDHLQAPFGEPVSQFDLGFGGLFTAKYLGAVGQMLLQDGAYGEYRLYSPGFVKQLPPRPLAEFAPNLTDKKDQWGIGFEWMMDPPGDRSKGVLGPNVFGHGSATASVWRIAPDHDLVVVIGRSGFKDWGETANWAARFMGVLAEGLEK
jgi:CubicO group peptidase (beta-lactamase class C family)